MRVPQAIHDYNSELDSPFREIADLLAAEIDLGLPEAESKIWHAHPVWFLGANPIVGYSKLTGPIRLMFWSGQSFPDPGLQPEGSFKAAEASYMDAGEVDRDLLSDWLASSRAIQWDYANIRRDRGVLRPLTGIRP